MAFQLIRFLPAGHGYFPGREIEYRHPADRRVLKGAARITGKTQRIREGVIEAVTKPSIQNGNMQQIDRRLGFTRKSVSMPLLVEVVIRGIFGPFQQIVICESAVIVIRIRRRVDRGVAGRKNRGLVGQIDQIIHGLLSAQTRKTHQVVDHVHGQVVLRHDSGGVVPVVDPIRRHRHHVFLGLEIRPRSGMIPFRILPLAQRGGVEGLVGEERRTHGPCDIDIDLAVVGPRRHVDIDAAAKRISDRRGAGDVVSQGNAVEASNRLTVTGFHIVHVSPHPDLVAAVDQGLRHGHGRDRARREISSRWLAGGLFIPQKLPPAGIQVCGVDGGGMGFD